MNFPQNSCKKKENILIINFKKRIKKPETKNHILLEAISLSNSYETS